MYKWMGSGLNGALVGFLAAEVFGPFGLEWWLCMLVVIAGNIIIEQGKDMYR